MGKFWSGIENALMILFTLAAIYCFTAPKNPVTAPPPPDLKAYKRACRSNMRLIEGALEWYYLDNQYKENTVAGVNELLYNGYLKSRPECASIKDDTDYIIHSYKIINGSVISEVECPVHGKAGLQATTDKNKGL